MLIIGLSGSGKTNALLLLINNLHPIDKIYLYAKDLSEKKYEFLINKREQAGKKNLNDPHAFIEYSNDMDDVLDNINNYNKNRDQKVLIVFDDMIADIMRNEKFKLKNFLLDVENCSSHCILMKIGNKKELKSIAEEK